jgi:hypothetical protein
VSKLLGINKIFTTAEHPQTDGAAERLNRFIVTALYAYVHKGQRNWDTLLPAISFAYRISVIEGIDFSPFMLVYGRRPVVPTDILYGTLPDSAGNVAKHHLGLLTTLRDVHEQAVKAQEKSDVRKSRNYDNAHSAKEFEVGDVVLLAIPNIRVSIARQDLQKFQDPYRKKGLSRKLLPRYSDPFRVEQKVNRLNYVVRSLSTGKQQRVHIQRMLQAHVRAPERHLVAEDRPDEKNDPLGSVGQEQKQDGVFDGKSEASEPAGIAAGPALSEAHKEVDAEPCVVDQRWTSGQLEFCVRIGQFSEWRSAADTPPILRLRFSALARARRARSIQ